MTPQEIEKKVKEVICQRLDVKPEQVVPEAAFRKDLNADSLGEMELVMALEEEFNLQIPEEDVESIKTVKDALSYITTHAKA